MFEPLRPRSALVMLALVVATAARADSLLGEIAVANPWAANVVMDLQGVDAISAIGDGTTVMRSLPTTELVHRRLAGDLAAKAAPMPAGINGRVTHRRTRANGADELRLSAFTVDKDNRVMFKLYPDIVIDLAAKSWRRDDSAGPSVAAGHGDADERALAAVRNYSAAFVERDLDRVVALSHPILLLREGGAKPYRAMISEVFDQMKAGGHVRAPETLGDASEAFVHGKTRMVGIPMIRQVGPHSVAAMYVAVSYDAGETWSVLNLSCTDERWLAAIAPGYRGTPDILGLANPETAKLLDGKLIDNALFLKGPKAGKSLAAPAT